MSAASDRLPRLLALVPWLRSHPGTRLGEIAETFGVSEKQVRDDLDLLWVCGLPGGGPGDLIDLAFEGDTVTLLDAQTLDRPLRLTADEAMALVVAARALAAVPGLSDRDALDRARAKIEQAAATAAGGSERVQVALEPAGDALGVIADALARGRRLHLRYLVESRDELTERDVDPIRVVNAEGRFYLDGWCHRAEALRRFRLDRVAEAVVLDVASEPPPDAVPRDLAEGLFAPGPDDLLVEIELAPRARWVVDYYPHETLYAGPDGTCVVGLRTGDLAWARRLVLRLGSAARVLSPPALAEQVRRTAAEALAAYAG